MIPGWGGDVVLGNILATTAGKNPRGNTALSLKASVNI